MAASARQSVMAGIARATISSFEYERSGSAQAQRVEDGLVVAHHTVCLPTMGTVAVQHLVWLCLQLSCNIWGVPAYGVALRATFPQTMGGKY